MLLILLKSVSLWISACYAVQVRLVEYNVTSKYC